jgi:putative transcriptional regulator
VQPELGAEVRDGPIGNRAEVLPEPRSVEGAFAAHLSDDAVVEIEELRITRELAQAARIDAPQHGDRVVPREVPERFVHHREEAPRVAAPAPGQVGGDCPELLDALGKVGDLLSDGRHGADNNDRCLGAAPRRAIQPIATSMLDMTSSMLYSRGCLFPAAMKNQLRTLRAERGWSQAALAGRLGVSRQTVNSIETERYEPSLSLAFRISRLFSKRIEDLFEPS